MKKLKSHNKFTRELTQLEVFRESTLYAFNETEKLLNHWKTNKFSFDIKNDFDYKLNRPKAFNLKQSAKDKRRSSLNNMVFVRVISALEVFLVDLIKDAFLITKEPFKNQDLRVDMTHAEILSIKSAKNFYNKIINKDCRKLSSGGFDDIVKYYKKHFKIELSNFSPGIIKMQEYHDRRHLLVHQLGLTDYQYRKKYNTHATSISIYDDYIINCFHDFKSFSKMVHDQMAYKIKNQFNDNRKVKTINEKKLFVIISFNEKMDGIELFTENFEFWSQDQFYLFKDILDQQMKIDKNTIEYLVSGTIKQVDDYLKIIKRESSKFNLKISTRKTKADVPKHKHYAMRNIDKELLQQIEILIPRQPWPKGVHKEIATKLNVSNKLVNVSIQQLIAQGKFKRQINGKVIDD